MEKKSQDWATRMNKNTVRLGYWTGAWLVTMAVATFRPHFIWHGHNVLTALAIITNLGIGFATIVANKHHYATVPDRRRLRGQRGGARL